MFVVRLFGRELFAVGRNESPESVRLGCQDLGIVHVLETTHNGEDYTPPARIGF